MIEHCLLWRQRMIVILLIILHIPYQYINTERRPNIELITNDIIVRNKYSCKINTRFRIDSPVGQGFGEASQFCMKNTCRIPCVFKGHQVVHFLDKYDHDLYTHETFCEQGSVDCAEDNNYLFCHFKDLHLKSYKEGIIYTPYRIQLNSTIALNCRSEVNPYFKIISSQNPRPENVTYKFGIFQYTYPTVMLQMLWHYILEQFIPQFYGWNFYFGANRSTQFITADEPNLIKNISKNHFWKIWSIISNKPLEIAELNTIYEEFNAGTIIAQKILKFSNGQCWDSVYNFTFFKLDELVLKMYEYYNVSVIKNKNPVIWLCKRTTKERNILNFDMMQYNIKKYFPNAEVYTPNFYELDFDQLIPMISRVDVLVSIHGSDLTNMVFMKRQSATIELHMYLFQARIMYTRVAEARKANHYVWYPRRNPFNTTLDWSADCLSGPCVGMNYCYQKANKQNLIVDIGAVIHYIAKALDNLGYNLNLTQYPGPGDIKGPGENLSFEL